MRRSGTMTLLAAMCVAAPGIAGPTETIDAAGMEQVLTMRVDGTISVDATGKVIGYELKTELEPAVRAVIDKAAPHWVFLPPEIDGKPTAVKTSMRITLLGRQVATGYQVSIDNVLFSQATYDDFPGVPKQERKEVAERKSKGGSMSIVSMTPMPKPPDFNINGMVTFMLDISPDGRVLAAAATQCSLYHAKGSPKVLAQACKAMETNVAQAVKRWTFRHEGGPAVAATGTIPFVFVQRGESGDMVAKASTPGAWRLEWRTPYRMPAWGRADRFAQRVGTSDSVGGGEVMPSSSPLRWRNGAMGTAL